MHPQTIDMAMAAPLMDNSRAKTELGWEPRHTAADALRVAVPALSVKAALTSGPQTLAALDTLADDAEKAGLVVALSGVKFLPPIPDPSKFFCVGKNTKKHREELLANQMLTEIPKEPTGFPSQVAPCAWQASSMTIRLWRLAISMMRSMSAGMP